MLARTSRSTGFSKFFSQIQLTSAAEILRENQSSFDFCTRRLKILPEQERDFQVCGINPEKISSNLETLVIIVLLGLLDDVQFLALAAAIVLGLEDQLMFDFVLLALEMQFH